MSNYLSIYNTSDVLDAGSVPVDELTIVHDVVDGVLEVGTIGDSNISDMDASKLTGTIPSSTVATDDVRVYHNGSDQLSIPDTFIDQALTTNSTVQFGNLSCANLSVSGTTTTVDSTTITVADSILLLANTDRDEDTLDMGWLGRYYNVSNKYAGVIRDATNKGFYLVENLAGPNAPVDVADRASFYCENLDCSGNLTTTGTINGYSLATLSASIGTNASGIAANLASIGTNASGISTNASGIAANLASIGTNASGISTNASGISTNASGISTNASGISTNATNIATNASAISTIQTELGEFANLTTAEIQQLENIDSYTFSNTDWGYLASIDQNLGTGNTVNFGKLTVNGATQGELYINSASPYDGRLRFLKAGVKQWDILHDNYGSTAEELTFQNASSQNVLRLTQAKDAIFSGNVSMSGYVGINGAAAIRPLNVKSHGTSVDVMKIVNSGGTDSLFEISEGGSSHCTVDIYNGSGAIRTRISAVNDSYFLDQVGFGKNSASYSLDVLGTANFDTKTTSDGGYTLYLDNTYSPSGSAGGTGIRMFNPAIASNPWQMFVAKSTGYFKIGRAGIWDALTIDTSGDILVNGTVDGVDLAAFKSDYDLKINQALTTTSTPTFYSLNLAGVGPILELKQYGSNYGYIRILSDDVWVSAAFDMYLKAADIISLDINGTSEAQANPGELQVHNHLNVDGTSNFAGTMTIPGNVNITGSFSAPYMYVNYLMTPTSTGTQTLSSIGFQPRYIRFTLLHFLVGGGRSINMHGFAYDNDGNGVFAVQSGYSDTAYGTSNSNVGCIYWASILLANITGVTSDSFTLTWATVNPSYQYQIMYECWA